MSQQSWGTQSLKRLKKNWQATASQLLMLKTKWRETSRSWEVKNGMEKHHIFPQHCEVVNCLMSTNCCWVPDRDTHAVKKKNWGGTRDLLSQVKLIRGWFGCLQWSLKDKSFAVSLHNNSIVCAAINMYWVCQNIQWRNRVSKHCGMFFRWSQSS